MVAPKQRRFDFFVSASIAAANALSNILGLIPDPTVPLAEVHLVPIFGPKTVEQNLVLLS